MRKWSTFIILRWGVQLKRKWAQVEWEKLDLCGNGFYDIGEFE